MVPSANEMAKAINVICGKLITEGVLEQESYGNAQRVINNLKNQGAATRWEYRVDRDEGFVFKSLADNQSNVYSPVVSVDKVSADDAILGVPPIRKLDVALELRYHHVERVLRWHFDQANVTESTDRKTGAIKYTPQHGPLYHVQYGGHVHIDRKLDVQVSLPRWSHPPMDLVLLLEAVTANFYPDAWENVRDDVAWCEQIRMAQRFCLEDYCQKLRKHLDTSNGTVLSSIWADRWLANAS